MARAALLQLIRLQSRSFSSWSFHTGNHPWETITWSQIQNKPTFDSSRHFTQKRWASQATITEEDNKITIGPRKAQQAGKDEKDTGFIYYGPISSTIKRVKFLSLSTCCLSASLGPVITFIASPDMSIILKGVVASSIIFFSGSTTAALHWFISPYIHKLKWEPGSDTFEAVMLTWRATYVSRIIRFADIRRPTTKRPFVSFEANGSYYFVDGKYCRNKDLLAMLNPRKRSE